MADRLPPIDPKAAHAKPTPECHEDCQIVQIKEDEWIDVHVVYCHTIVMQRMMEKVARRG